MTGLELAFNQLAEASATALSKVKNPKGYDESRRIAQEGGSIAGNARRELESHLEEIILSPLNAKEPAALDVQSNEDTDK